MADVIKIKKGLDINIQGKAPLYFVKTYQSDSYAIVPDDYCGITPKVTVRAGDKVKAGTTLMTDKNHPEIRFVSPVSGEVTGVNRGDKRKILNITVKADGTQEYEDFGKAPADAEGIKNMLLQAGMWAFIRQRPYDRVPDPAIKPRDIFVTAYNSAPLAPDFEFILNGETAALQKGLDALTKLTDGNVFVGIKKGCDLKLNNVTTVELDGPHPAGNVGVMINHLKPVNKGETVWTLAAADVLIIGRLLLTGKADFSRIIALTGSEMSNRGYVKALTGCKIASLVHGRVLTDDTVRVISGNVLTGKKVSLDDYLGFYDTQITAIPEGSDVNEFVGWAAPGFGKFSVSRAYPAAWLNVFWKKPYTLDARIKGGKRAMIMSNEYDRVFPFDILPEYLLKAIIAFDIDKMERLGIYEVAPEDFALCEFVDTSKIEIQKIVRQGLDLLYKEMN
ncbi:MAG: Na(+)-translocating NADH-quinone reductase subunit A [Tannerella sp.]|jgi:Na+-transporting NADH:ubiquinone oxidoreductase subunit A|nr:Na(+)-translocating NADH-quinone reductase subunit A [Tannerella sp.]